MSDGLKARYRRQIIAILGANPRVEAVVLFGSRALGSFTPASDVDLALYGDQLTLTDLADLQAEIEATSIPQQVDLVLAHRIDSEQLRAHLRRHGVEWLRRRPADGAGARAPGRRK